MAVDVIAYETELAQDFYNLNIEWLQTHFVVEPYDEAVLSNPEHYIINKGGSIFFARVNNQIAGTVALMPTVDATVLELTKMAVLPEMRGQKIGQLMLQHCTEFAKHRKFSKLLLYSNTKLENAIYLYRKFGFEEIPVETNAPYKRGNIKMLLVL